MGEPYDVEMRRMVVVIPVPVLNLAFAGAGMPGREALPGIGSGAGLSDLRKGFEAEVSKGSAGIEDKIAGAELVEATLDLLVTADRLIPNELAIALREDVTDAMDMHDKHTRV